MACGGRILIIDPDPGSRERIAGFVREMGCCAETAAEPATGLARLMEGGPPCLVLVELELPRLAGADLIARLRANGAGDDVCILSMSGPGTGAQAPPAVERHLTRPFSLDVLWPIIERRCRQAIRLDADPFAVRAEADV